MMGNKSEELLFVFLLVFCSKLSLSDKLFIVTLSDVSVKRSRVAGCCHQTGFHQ